MSESNHYVLDLELQLAQTIARDAPISKLLQEGVAGAFSLAVGPASVRDLSLRETSTEPGSPERGGVFTSAISSNLRLPEPSGKIADSAKDTTMPATILDLKGQGGYQNSLVKGRWSGGLEPYRRDFADLGLIDDSGRVVESDHVEITKDSPSGFFQVEGPQIAKISITRKDPSGHPFQTTDGSCRPLPGSEQIDKTTGSGRLSSCSFHVHDMRYGDVWLDGAGSSDRFNFLVTDRDDTNGSLRLRGILQQSLRADGTGSTEVVSSTIKTEESTGQP